jgi:hypothetical protein
MSKEKTKRTSRKKSSTFYNMVTVDGFFVSISALPEKYQKVAREAKERGGDISFYSNQTKKKRLRKPRSRFFNFQNFPLSASNDHQKTEFQKSVLHE